MGADKFVLLIDIGNSRVKWGRAGNGAVAPGVSFDTHDPMALKRFLAELKVDPPPSQIMVSNVAGKEIAARLTDGCEEGLGVAPKFIRSQARGFGVVNAYQAPERLGVDRWAALIGARRLGAGPWCVADVGTAITWDVLDAEGRHLGGLIAPGLGLMRRSLIQGTSDLIAAAEVRRDRLARDTASCISCGARQAAAGLLERGFREAARRLGTPPGVLLTGGDAAEIAAELEIPHQSRPHLVLEGLWVMAGTYPEAMP